MKSKNISSTSRPSGKKDIGEKSALLGRAAGKQYPWERAGLQLEQKKDERRRSDSGLC